MLELDPGWDDVVDAVAAELFPGVTEGAILQAIAELSDRYNQRATRPPGREALAAGLAFFLRADLLKIPVCLAECEAAGVGWPRELCILDVGSGLGTAGLGALEHLDGSAAVDLVRVVALDRDSGALEVGHRLHAAARHRFAKSVWEAHSWDARHDGLGRHGPFDLVLVQNVLCELAGGPDDLVHALLGALAPVGTLVIVEPALRETSRALCSLRDRLVAEGRCTVLAPCTRAGSCPALVDPKDWCHEDRPFVPSPGLARLVRATGLRRFGLKFSYLTVRGDGLSLGASSGLRRPERVVSAPLASKGKLELYTCGPDGKRRLTLLRRSRSEANTALEVAARGDLLSIDKLDDRCRIEEETRVERWSLNPA